MPQTVGAASPNTTPTCGVPPPSRHKSSAMENLPTPPSDDAKLPVEAGPDAPWIDAPDGWTTSSQESGSLRPGDYCFLPSRQAFVRAIAVTHLKGSEPTVFVDLSDGHTLCLHPTERIFTRTSRLG